MTDEVKRCVDMLREGACCSYCAIAFPTVGYPYPCEERAKTNSNMDKAADLIESLSAELEQVKQERDESNRILAQVRAALESRIVEIDQREIVKSCDNCTQAERLYNLTCSIEYCRDCRDFSKWKYNGVKD